jgi:hypothetical protein
MTRSSRKSQWIKAGLITVVFGLGACTESQKGEPETREQTVAPAPSVPLGVSLNAVMVGLVDHASHSIWDAATPQKAPKNDKAWEEIQHHAIQLAAAGSVIAMPGTGGSDAAWVKNPEWQRYAKELSDIGAQAWDAAKKKDMKAISDVGDKLVANCESCHKAYKGDLPTEGILHPH